MFWCFYGWFCAFSSYLKQRKQPSYETYTAGRKYTRWFFNEKKNACCAHHQNIVYREYFHFFQFTKQFTTKVFLSCNAIFTTGKLNREQFAFLIEQKVFQKVFSNFFFEIQCKHTLLIIWVPIIIFKVYEMGHSPAHSLSQSQGMIVMKYLPFFDKSLSHTK